MNISHGIDKKPVLFVPCYSGHVRTFHPVVRRMQEAGGYDPYVIFQEGIHPPSLEDYCQRYHLPLMKMRLPVYGGPEGKGLASKAANAWRYYRHLREVQNAVGHLFDSVKPAFVVTATDGFQNDVYYLFEAHRRRVPSLCLYSSITSADVARDFASVTSRSVLHRFFRRLLSLVGLPTRDAPVTSGGYVEKVSLWGEHHRQALLSRGADPAKLVITGSPAHDLIYERCHQQNTLPGDVAARRSLGIGDGHGVFLYCTQPLASDGLISVEDERRLNRQVADVCTSFPDYVLAIKLHPRETKEQYAYLADHPRADCIRVFAEQDSDLHDLMIVADVVFTQSSTTSMDAVLFGKDLVLLEERLRVRDAHGLVRSGAGLSVIDTARLFDILSDLLNDEGAKARLAEGRRRFIEQYIGEYDGRSTERVLALMERMMREKR